MARHPLIACLLLTLAVSAAAQDERQYRAGDSVDPRDVATILGQPPAIKMRSIRLLDTAPAKPAAARAAPDAPAGGSAAPPVADSLSLPVQFAFDSAEILPSARQQLDALAEGIRLLPATKSVLIQGHTDATGSDQYNAQLSQRRAQAVKRYLVASQGIDASRLRAVGKGEQQPLPGSDPHAAENRRVQFRGE